MQVSMVAASFVEAQRLRGLSPRTVEFYQWGMNHLAKHCSVLPEHHRELLALLSNERLSRESRYDLERVLLKFFHWAAQEYDIPDPTIGLERVHRKKILPRVLTHDEVAAIWAACLNCRDQALVGLALDPGLRVGEITAMTKTDLDPFGLRVDGKVGQRQVPISPQLRNMLLPLGDSAHFRLGREGHCLTYWGGKNAFRRVFHRAGLQARKLVLSQR